MNGIPPLSPNRARSRARARRRPRSAGEEATEATRRATSRASLVALTVAAARSRLTATMPARVTSKSMPSMPKNFRSYFYANCFLSSRIWRTLRARVAGV
jgi:hypothetical protein